MTRQPRTFFTSDLHLGHRLVAAHRGFGEDVDAHDIAIMDNWRAVVHPEDTVWVLGDLAVSSPWRALFLLSTLPGHKRLVAGNHDKVHPLNRNAHKHQRRYMEVFDSICTAARMKINDHEVRLSHFPYRADRGDEPRYMEWRLPNYGIPLLHGHLHTPDVLSLDEGTLQVHVGLDAWSLFPVPRETVAGLLD